MKEEAHARDLNTLNAKKRVRGTTGANVVPFVGATKDVERNSDVEDNPPEAIKPKETL